MRPDRLDRLVGPTYFKRMKILIVGAGAVGSVYGYTFQRAGHSITYLVKPKHLESVRGGIRIYHHLRKRKHESILFKDFATVTTPAEARVSQWNLVVLTMASNSVRDADWVQPLLGGLPPETTVFSLQPNAEDLRALIAQSGLPASQFVSGSIPFMAYLAPLPGESFPETGYAFWNPSVCGVSGDRERAESVISALNSGGMKAKYSSRPATSMLYAEALLRTLVAALEKKEWNLDALLHSELFPIMLEATREAIPISAKEKNLSDPLRRIGGKLPTRGFFVRAVIRILQKIAPFDLEAFVRVHFTKVEDQMQLGMRELIETGKRNRFHTNALTLLARR